MYLDDLRLLGRNSPLLKNLKRQLMGRFSLTDIEKVSLVLGMKITTDREARTPTISQE